jgi:hypothetical protein
VVLLVMAGTCSGAYVRATPTGPGAYKLEAGPWRAASEDLTLHDDRRQKDLEVTVRHPAIAAEAAGRFPMVVFSHGAGGSRAAFADLTTHWASHGYIVVLPTHADSIQLRRRSGEDLSRLRRDPDSLRRAVRPRVPSLRGDRGIQRREGDAGTEADSGIMRIGCATRLRRETPA